MSVTDLARKSILRQTENFVQARMEKNVCGHDFWHVKRVRKLALQIGEAEGADLFLVEMAALLHDLGDAKLHASEEEGDKVLDGYLSGCGLEPHIGAQIKNIIAGVSYSKSLDGMPSTESLEMRTVRDADRLDAIGAIGLARTFAYAGSRAHSIHDPTLPPRTEMTGKEYRQGRSTAINHVHEKLLKLKDAMVTKAGKKLARPRHAFLRRFLVQFEMEWNSEEV